METLDFLNTKKLYVKFFDIDINEKKEPIPLAALRCEMLLNDSIQVIPTIFITNRTLQNINAPGINKLSQRALQKINDIWSSVSSNRIKEIQFDSDWTVSTKDQYFSFLKNFKKTLLQNGQADCILSSTIRLHQIKYDQQTGVPPVSRGMLMFYNMADLEQWETRNSILDLAVAKQYLSENQSYPLPLDIALPIFRWGVLFRNGKMIKLINNLDVTDLQDSSRFDALSENQYEVKKSTYLKAYYLYTGDELRLEWQSSAELISAAQYLNSVLPNNKITVSLYHLDTSTLKHYRNETLQQVFQSFSKD